MEVEERVLIDVDSHFVEPPNWLDLVDPALAKKVAEVAPTSMGEQAIGEVFESIPEEGRPPFEEFVPEGLRKVFAKFEGREGAELEDVFADNPEIAVMFNPPGARGGADRVKVCDEQGIAVQVINPNLAMAVANAARKADAKLGLRVIEAYNTWAASAVEGYTDRLLYTTVLLLDDMDWAVAELGKNRATGSRTFAMPLNPVNGRGLGDPFYDPLWQASLELGMTPLVHVGFGWPQVATDWLRAGDGFDPRTSMAMSVALMPTLPQTVMSHMIHRGVFDRFPDLVVFCQEFGLSWISSWLDGLGATTRTGAPTGNMFFGWDHKASPEEILAKNIRFTPLFGQAVDSVIDEFGPELVCYASDYPHFEGIAQDWSYYDRQLEGYSSDVKDRFYAGNATAILGL